MVALLNGLVAWLSMRESLILLEIVRVVRIKQGPTNADISWLDALATTVIAIVATITTSTIINTSISRT